MQAYLASKAVMQYCAAIETHINGSHHYASVKLPLPLKYSGLAR
jgi:hypothetical protein